MAQSPSHSFSRSYGTISTPHTDQLDAATFSCEEIADLYRRRWEVETHYRDEKVHLDVETFHTRGVNGIHQELFAVAIMALGQDVAMRVADDPVRALAQFTELLEQIGSVKYYRPKHPRPSALRGTKRKINKWIKGRADRMNVA